MAGARTVLITGASRGLGRALALIMGDAGWHVIAAARAQGALESLDDEIKARGGLAPTLIPMDLMDHDSIDRMGAALYERFGALDALGACAGLLGDITPVFQAKPRMMERVFSTNTIANYRLIRSLDPLLRRAPAARVVFVTSGIVRRLRAYWGPYAASKAALEALVVCYAQEAAMLPMRVNLFDPGRMATAMRARAYPGEDQTLLPRPDEVAREMLALFAPELAVHGQILDRAGVQALPSG